MKITKKEGNFVTDLLKEIISCDAFADKNSHNYFESIPRTYYRLETL